MVLICGARKRHIVSLLPGRWRHAENIFPHGKMFSPSASGPDDGSRFFSVLIRGDELLRGVHGEPGLAR